MPHAPLRFGNFLAPNATPIYRAVADYVSQRLNCPTLLEIGTSYDQVHQDFDVCFICGLAYVELAQGPSPVMEPIAAPVLEGARYQGLPIYFSDVVVHQNSPFFSFEDLRGRSWSYNEPYSQSGFGVVCYRLAEMGENPSFFGRVIEAGWHERSLELICSGKIDASAIDTHVLSITMQERPELRSQLRIIDTLGPSTIQPVTVARWVSARLREKLQQALIEMASVPEMQARLREGGIERFVPVDDRSYDDLRNMRALSKSSGCRDLILTR